MQSLPRSFCILATLLLSMTPVMPAMQVVPQTRGVQDANTPGMSDMTLGPFYALAIGNNKYQFLNQLGTAENDAQAMAKLLKEKYGFQTTLLLNATRSQIIDALVSLRDTLPAHSHLVIYYAGHGKNDPDAKVAYWLPVDARPVNSSNWISSDDITAELRVIKADHVLIIADSCFAGAMMRDATATGDLRAEINPQQMTYYLAKIERIRSRDFLASGGVEPVADGGADGHSIFAAVVLDTLKNATEAEFTATTLFQTIAARVGGRSLQTPQYYAIVNSGHDGGDFIFYRTPHPSIPMACCMLPGNGDSRSGADSASDFAENTQEQIQQVLDQYRLAYNNRDLDALRKLWPDMTPQVSKNLQQFFGSASSISITCNVLHPPTVLNDTASLDFNEVGEYASNGRPQKINQQKARMTLKRVPDGSGKGTWKIESIN